MTSLILIDAVRYAHLLAVAVGLGASAMADMQVMRHVDRRVSLNLLDLLRQLHGVVWAALIVMWLTGIALIYIRTGFVLGEFTPKLFSKLAIVFILTLNAMLIGRIGLPLLLGCIKVRLMDLPLGQKLTGAWLAALSTASWLMALALGGSQVLAVSGWGVFLELVPLIYFLGLGAATLVVLALHFRGVQAWTMPAE